jgi:hypothetical protein
MIEHRTVSGTTPSHTGSRERFGVAALALAVVGAIAAYLLLGPRRTSDAARDLLPYQTLADTLPDTDQQMFRAIRQALRSAEQDRSRGGVWPEPAELAARGLAPFASDGSAGGYRWTRLQQAAIIDYFGQPADAASPAWLLEIQEPEPGMLPDPAPPDEEHQRLADGTMLHTYVWMHRYGGQVPVGFVRQPQNSGWTEVFSKSPDPVYYNRR